MLHTKDGIRKNVVVLGNFSICLEKGGSYCYMNIFFHLNSISVEVKSVIITCIKL